MIQGMLPSKNLGTSLNLRYVRTYVFTSHVGSTPQELFLDDSKNHSVKPNLVLFKLDHSSRYNHKKNLPCTYHHNRYWRYYDTVFSGILND